MSGDEAISWEVGADGAYSPRDCFASLCEARNDKVGVRGFIQGESAELAMTKALSAAGSQAVKVNLLPVAHSTSFSGISFFASSMKFVPLQCIGSTCSRSNFLSSAITCRR